MNELTKKKIGRSEEQWRTIIAEQVQSGESIQRFCRREVSAIRRSDNGSHAYRGSHRQLAVTVIL